MIFDAADYVDGIDFYFPSLPPLSSGSLTLEEQVEDILAGFKKLLGES